MTHRPANWFSRAVESARGFVAPHRVAPRRVCGLIATFN